jgi:REP element-mobilizing transposase RayT
MAHSFSRIHIHLVFSTKDRRDSIPKEWQPRLWAYFGGICRNHEIIPLAIGGTENHAHLLIQIPPTLAPAKAVAVLKANSSKWMGEQGQKFAWQVGAGSTWSPPRNKDTARSASVHRISIRSFGTSKTRRRIIERPVLRTNFALCFVSMAWNMIPSGCLGETLEWGDAGRLPMGRAKMCRPSGA